MNPTNTYSIPINISTLENQLGVYFGTDITLEKYEAIKHKKGVSVARLYLRTANQNLYSVIIKHTEDKEISPSLEKEMLVYRFLMNIETQFRDFPKLIAFTKHLLIIEDLGVDELDFENELIAQKSAIKTLAGLHAASLNQVAGYQKLKEDNISAFSTKEPVFEKLYENFQIGNQYIYSLFDVFGLEISSFKKTIEKARQIVHSSSQFYALIHGDFISRRQSIVKNGNFYLLDFEHSRFDHALIDFWQLYVGKIEYNTNTGYYFRKRFEYLENIENHYRLKFESFSGETISDEDWQINLEASLIYTVFGVIGNLIIMPDKLEALGLSLQPVIPFEEELQLMFTFLIDHISENSQFLPLRNTVNDSLLKFEKLQALKNGTFRKQNEAKDINL